MNVIPILNARFGEAGFQDVTVTETVIDPMKGSIRCNISGGGNIRLPPIAEAGGLAPFFLTAVQAGNQVILDNIADGGVTTVTTLASGGTAEAIVWYDGFAWRSLNMTAYAGSALLGTLLSRNDSTGVQEVTGTASVTNGKQVITLAGTTAYNVTLPTVALTEAMPYFFIVKGTTGLIVTIMASDGTTPVGTLTADKEVAGIVVADGSVNYLIPIPLNSVCGPTSATNNDIALFDGATGEIIKDSGIQTETTLSVASDTKIPTSKAINTYAVALKSKTEAFIIDGAPNVEDTVIQVNHTDCTKLTMPTEAAASGHVYHLSTSVAGNTIIANDADVTLFTLNSGLIQQALLWSDGTNWHYIDLTSTAYSTLLQTILTRTDSTGILAVNAAGAITTLDSVISLTGTSYDLTLPADADIDAFQWVLLMGASGTVTVKDAGGNTVGTLVAGIDAGGIVGYQGGTSEYLLKFPIYPVCGLTSATASDFAQFDGTSGKLLKGGLALETAITDSDVKVPSSGAVVDYAQPIPAAAVSGNIGSFNASKVLVDSEIPATMLLARAKTATITLGGENTDVSREATIQLKDAKGANLAVLGSCLIYATGEAGAADTGVLAVCGTDYDTLEVKAANGLQIGPALAGTDKAVLHAVSTAAGVIVLTFADATANTSIFLHVILPDGDVVTSAQFEVGHA